MPPDQKHFSGYPIRGLDITLEANRILFLEGSNNEINGHLNNTKEEP